MFLQGINVAHEENADERKHRAEDQIGLGRQHFLVNHGPRVKENYFDIEKNEKNAAFFML